MIHEATERVRLMEMYFDKLSETVSTDPDLLKSDDTVKEMLNKLTQYYESGLWLKDYELDEKGHVNIKKLYLDPFLDMFNGEILSYGISKTPSAASILSAQKKAIEITADCPYRRTFHSDRGWAYQMSLYTHELKENKIFQSMSRKGNCYDNSVMENFFGLLKQEMYYGITYYSFEELKETIEKYIKYYNEKRIKQKLGWMSPVEYRLSFLVA